MSKKLTYKILKEFCQSCFPKKPPEKNGFRASFIPENDPHRLHTYQPSLFGKWGIWYIEKCDNNNIILSLQRYECNKQSKFKYHITVLAATWDDKHEYHVTIEDIIEREGRFFTSKVCSTFFQYGGNKPEVIFLFRTNRPSCISRTRTHFGDITMEHASKFFSLLKLLSEAKQSVCPVYPSVQSIRFQKV